MTVEIRDEFRLAGNPMSGVVKQGSNACMHYG
jgi:hypothetical protein